MGDIDLSTTVKQGVNSVTADLGGELALLSIEKGHYYSLDPVGSQIWTLIAEPRTIKDVCDRLVARYAVSREDCERDVLAFLEDLTRERLAEICGREKS
ncbi:MAG: lasso peptide biosynthesis PqqD family chaperone [Deltaproteobacteria bacterium]|nr:lasso peptide biosynthesis PqqD family chaperone [Deltaproteobacteria bacterium]